MNLVCLHDLGWTLRWPWLHRKGWTLAYGTGPCDHDRALRRMPTWTDLVCLVLRHKNRFLTPTHNNVCVRCEKHRCRNKHGSGAPDHGSGWSEPAARWPAGYPCV